MGFSSSFVPLTLLVLLSTSGCANRLKHTVESTASLSPPRVGRLGGRLERLFMWSRPDPSTQVGRGRRQALYRTLGRVSQPPQLRTVAQQVPRAPPQMNLGTAARYGLLGGAGFAMSYADQNPALSQPAQDIKGISPIWDLSLKKSQEESPGFFRIFDEGFTYLSDFFDSQGQQSIVAHASREDGLSLVMKRPKYTDELWEDNLQKECFMARYLNAAGVSRVPACVGERVFTQDEVKALKASKHRQWRDEYDNDGQWHAVFFETAKGSLQASIGGYLAIREARKDASIVPQPISLGNEAAEKKAVRQMIETTGQMLNAGVVNTDQWHNILFTADGDATFIDFGEASFLNQHPLDVAKANGESLEYKRRYQIPMYKKVNGEWEKQSNHGEYVIEDIEQKTLEPIEAVGSAKAMVTSILRLVPEHALGEAEDAIRSRVRNDDPQLDSIFEKAWQEHTTLISSTIK